SILQVLKDRGYVKLEKKRLHGEDKGRVVIAFLESFFSRYVEYDFTADLEEQLDRISNNEISWQQVLKDFWRDFIGAVDDIKDLRVAQVLDVLDEMLGPHIYPPRADGGDVRQCPNCGTGRLNLKAGKFGAFVGCSNYPECRYTRQLAADSAEASADRSLGQDPDTGFEVWVKAGRFGPYIQLGEPKDYAEGEKPKRAGIPKGTSPGDVDLELALKLLSLPREIGRHPETGQPITAGLGRFGPFVKHEKTYASLEAGDEVFDIGLNRAVTLIAEKAAKGPSRRFGSDPGKAIGDHPSLGTISVKSGRYGPYVTAGGVNATIPSEIEKDAITLPQAIALIDERAAKGGGKAKTSKAKKAGKAAKIKTSADGEPGPEPGKKSAAKKPAAKKAAAKSKSESTSKARAAVSSTAKTSPTKSAAAAKAPAKKSAGKN
ncbi:MAG: topoisomerase DNA-binding C4 zinc finger domain-containing protein, partial [Porphyrobacter sp.]|nr:topoisomerase DNA-binding C4 zinc finger domain-containing protein [Porphyrobacter sp.]